MRKRKTETRNESEIGDIESIVARAHHQKGRDKAKEREKERERSANCTSHCEFQPDCM